jgi:NAD(P)H-hydrate epimerase
MSPPTIIREVPQLSPRSPDAHKGVFGHVLVVAGSRGMSGAAVLCASSALRGGAGLVTLAVPEGILPIVAASNPCYMTAPLPQDEAGRVTASALPHLQSLIQARTVAVLGPGLGHQLDLARLLTALLDQTTAPLVLDADALNALASQPDVLGRHPGRFVLTPHPGEFARLLGRTTAVVQANRQEHAVRFAEAQRIVLVLKGHQTIVTDGAQLYINTTGNPGMATGGSGDVLGGLLAALIGQRLDLFAAARLGVYLHGLAGDLARDDLGENSLIASDLLDYLPRAFRAYAGASRAAEKSP